MSIQNIGRSIPLMENFIFCEVSEYFGSLYLVRIFDEIFDYMLFRMFDKDGEARCGTRYNQNMDVIYTDINGITLLKMHKGYASTNKYKHDCLTVT